MARLTKIELEQRLDAALKDVEQLRLALAVAEGNVTAYREHGNKLEDELKALRGEGSSLDADVTGKALTFRERCARARRVAMASGRCVKVA